MGTTPIFNTNPNLKSKIELSSKIENKLQKILRKKDIAPLTVKEYNNSRLKAYSAVR